MPARTTIERLTPLAHEQWGLLTRRQAKLAGVPQATLTRLIEGRSTLERVANGVYHLMGAPWPDHAELRAAWLQLAPGMPSWERTPDQGVVSHTSAAALYGIGDLPADVHQFTVASRRQTRRPDVRIHVRDMSDLLWIKLHGLPVTRPSRIAADLLADREEPEAVARIVSEATRHVYDYPGTFAKALAPLAMRYGLRKGDGYALLRWLYDLVGDPEREVWLDEARASLARESE
jgi:hypothetical protein